MMSEYRVEVKFPYSVEEVYELWQNLENVPRWMPLVKEVKVLPGSEELSRWKFGLGFPLITEWTSHITQRVPQKLIAWESISGFSNRGCAEFFPTEQGCRLRLTVAFELPGGIIGAFLETVGVDRWLEANLVESLNRFRSLIEEEILRQRNE
jgi:uncharacterized membrane protein